MRKVRFEAYVMAAFFDQILRQANKRLTRMTQGRYQLIRYELDTDLSLSLIHISSSCWRRSASASRWPSASSAASSRPFCAASRAQRRCV